MSARLMLVLILVHAAVAVLFLRDVGPGFPLDDSWLHMVYARSFSQGQGFAYNPGQFETGVTAPLWTTLLALPVGISDALGRRPDLGVRILGALVGLLLAWTGARLAGRAGRWPAMFTALALSLDPHLVFDRFSGMELPLFGLLSVLLVGALLDNSAGRAGLLCGALALTRPEGLVLAAVGLGWVVRRRLKLMRFLLPIVLCVVPWMAYCLLVSGRPWPSTLETKVDPVLDPQALFASIDALFGDMGWGWALPLAAAVGVFSLEGGRRDLGLLPVLCVVSLLAAVLLSRRMEVAHEPVSRVPYYWARYAQVAWPLALMVAATGMAALVRTAYAGLLCKPGYAVVLIGPLVIILALGSSLPAQAHELRQRFGAECAHTEALHVAAGLWLDATLPATALVATHDAGAVRYFGNRPVLDIWGNHTHELLRIEREQGPAAVGRWVKQQDVDALVVFPALWARNHSPEFQEIWRTLPPHEGAALDAAADDWASLLGLTKRAASFHVDEPATVPGPLHADLAVFVQP